VFYEAELIMAEIAALPSEELEKLWVEELRRRAPLGLNNGARRRKISRIGDKSHAYGGTDPSYSFDIETSLPSLLKTTSPRKAFSR
jgi:hypothetical protein